MISAIKVDLEDNGLGGVHHRTLRSLGWLNYKTSNGSKPKRCQHELVSTAPSHLRAHSTLSDESVEDLLQESVISGGAPSQLLPSDPLLINLSTYRT